MDIYAARDQYGKHAVTLLNCLSYLHIHYVVLNSVYVCRFWICVPILYYKTSHNALLCFFSFVPSGKCDGCKLNILSN